MTGEIITLQVGQCGNQLGAALYSTLAREIQYCNTPDKCPSILHDIKHLFRRAGDVLVPRSLLIDMEPKVIQNALSNTDKFWRYDDTNAVWQQSGSANNWAYGYSVHGEAVRDRISESVRREVALAVHPQGFLMLQSLAGGTGSGIGCYIAELLRDEYPKTILNNIVVAPFQSGEVSSQYYNAVLAFRSLYCASDGLLLLENDKLHETCRKLLHINHIDLKSMNNVAANTLSQILLPSAALPAIPTDHKCTLSSVQPPYRSNSYVLRDVLASLYTHPCYRLSTGYTIPQIPDKSAAYSDYPWSMLVKHLTQMAVTGHHMEDGIDWSVDVTTSAAHRLCKSVSNVLFLRGFHQKPLSKPSSPGAGPDVIDLTAMSCSRLYPHWQYAPLRVAVHPSPVSMYSRSGVMVSNSAAVLPCLNFWACKGQEMFRARAFVHHYEKFGVECDQFVESFATIEQVIRDYKNL